MSVAPSSDQLQNHEVMASIDTDGYVPRLVIADITADETWLSIHATSAVSLADWR